MRSTREAKEQNKRKSPGAKQLNPQPGTNTKQYKRGKKNPSTRRQRGYKQNNTKILQEAKNQAHKLSITHKITITTITIKKISINTTYHNSQNQNHFSSPKQKQKNQRRENTQQNKQRRFVFFSFGQQQKPTHYL
jgi:hypothetical protein